ncbi:MAG: nuc [Gaiellaceae bacterium]|nr:nuc [Gaiellaceae bacterium]
MGADRLIAAALGGLLLTGCSATAAEVGSDRGRVARVTDGDTLRLTDGRRIRLVQVDAPEPRTECWGEQATRALTELVPPGAAVELERDPRLDDRDRFGRLLRYVTRDGRLLNVALVERGAAAPYFFRGEQGRHADELLDAGQSALAARRGLWGGCPAATLDPDRALAAGPG